MYAQRININLLFYIGLEDVLISIYGQLKEVADDLADISESEE